MCLSSTKEEFSFILKTFSDETGNLAVKEDLGYNEENTGTAHCSFICRLVTGFEWYSNCISVCSGMRYLKNYFTLKSTGIHNLSCIKPNFEGFHSLPVSIYV